MEEERRSLGRWRGQAHCGRRRTGRGHSGTHRNGEKHHALQRDGNRRKSSPSDQGTVFESRAADDRWCTSAPGVVVVAADTAWEVHRTPDGPAAWAPVRTVARVHYSRALVQARRSLAARTAEQARCSPAVHTEGQVRCSPESSTGRDVEEALRSPAAHTAPEPVLGHCTELEHHTEGPHTEVAVQQPRIERGQEAVLRSSFVGLMVGGLRSIAQPRARCSNPAVVAEAIAVGCSTDPWRAKARRKSLSAEASPSRSPTRTCTRAQTGKVR